VSIDVKAWEKGHSQVTEIGITTLNIAKSLQALELATLKMADIDYENLDHGTKTLCRNLLSLLITSTLAINYQYSRY
jgi:hypothetical protein